MRVVWFPVREDDGGAFQINHWKLVKAIQELKAENESLKASVAELDELKTKVAQFELTLEKLSAATRENVGGNTTVSAGR